MDKIKQYFFGEVCAARESIADWIFVFRGKIEEKAATRRRATKLGMRCWICVHVFGAHRIWSEGADDNGKLTLFLFRHPERSEGSTQRPTRTMSTRSTNSVYILASRASGTFYVGLTSDLRTRIGQHRAGSFDGFTRKYRVTRLVYFEAYRRVRPALERERQLKSWLRQRKITLIEQQNPAWVDLAAGW